ncbi:MAG TPA: hypothetical protein VJ486_06755 [Geothrix sp.]|nr:hypothetical protein [Geothrix sp.]
MQRSWIMAITMATGLLAQAPTTEPPPAPAPAESPAPEAKPAPEMKPQEPAAPTDPLKGTSFEQLRPSQRKFAYALYRSALAAHELGLYRSHPKAVEVRAALEALLQVKTDLPDKAKGAIPAVEAYVASLQANHGLYDAEGKKLLMTGTWKDLQGTARATAKLGVKGLETRLQKLKDLLFDAKVDAVAPTWEAAAPAAKGKKAKAPKVQVPEGFKDQKVTLALWLKRSQAWVENVHQEVEVNGVKKVKRLPDPAKTKSLGDLIGWLEKDDLDLLRDPGFGWLDLRRLGAEPGMALLAHADDIAASKAPEGAATPLGLFPTFEPVMAESKFDKGEEKRKVLAEVKQGPPAASLAAQMAVYEKLARSREIEVK